MEGEDQRALWTSLVEDLEDECQSQQSSSCSSVSSSPTPPASPSPPPPKPPHPPKQQQQRSPPTQQQQQPQPQQPPPSQSGNNKNNNNNGGNGGETASPMAAMQFSIGGGSWTSALSSSSSSMLHAKRRRPRRTNNNNNSNGGSIGGSGIGIGSSNYGHQYGGASLSLPTIRGIGGGGGSASSLLPTIRGIGGGGGFGGGFGGTFGGGFGGGGFGGGSTLLPPMGGVVTAEASSPFSSYNNVPMLPVAAPLEEWMGYHEREGQDAKACSVMSWRGTAARGKNEREDKTYLEKAARIALSLATKLERKSSEIRTRDVAVANVVVTNTLCGEADFIRTSGGGNDGGFTMTNDDERAKIYALGRVLYEMFTRESFPSVPSRETMMVHNSNVATTTTAVTGSSMNIGEGGEAGKDNDDDDDEGEEHASRPQRRRRDDEGPKASIRTRLEGKGMPGSICRLLTDMLDNNDHLGPLGGLLFCSDQAISSLKDVVDDLSQMAEHPKSFLHDSLLRRWKPVMSDDKLYGRDAELKRAVDVAGRVSLCGTELEEDDVAASLEVLMVSGHSGSGKSHLVRELSGVLERRGWRCLYCKFDRINPHPLSFIISAFESFLHKLSSENGGGELREIQEQITKSFLNNENMNALCHLAPALRLVMTEKGMPSEDGIDFNEEMPGNDGIDFDEEMPSNDGIDFDHTDTELFKCRLHHLFGLLLKAISRKKPAILFLDDLHWADQASLDLIMALVHQQANEGSRVLFVGTYRPNTSDSLDVSLGQIRSLSNMTITEMPLDGLTCDDVNGMVSEALSYPRRLTRTLSSLIHRKTTGNPLFVKEFLTGLVAENQLNYSLSSKRWEWDEDLIQSRTISDGVADLLTRRLLRLPTESVAALQVVSIFGSRVSMQVLAHVRDVCGITDIVAELDLPEREGLVTTGAKTCAFVHDMIHQSVSMGIKVEDRKKILKQVSQTLLVRTSNNRSDAELFILVDLINRVGPEGATAVDRIRYANLNLLAGEKAIQTPDYGKACTYLESGISFLEEDHWTNNYNLSLHLFKNAAFAQHAKGGTELMLNHVNEVLENAQNFYDKLDTYNVLIHWLSCDTDNVSKAFEQSFLVLKELGESFPAIPDKDIIIKELLDAKSLLEQHVPSSLANIPPMESLQKIKAMGFFFILLQTCYQQKSPYLPLVACRAVKITMQYGTNENSSYGFCMFALTYATIFNDISKGYRIGKYALAVAKGNNMAVGFVYGLINIWKEPLQAVLPELMEAYKEGMKVQSISPALTNSMLYAYRAFFSGLKLAPLREEMGNFIREYTLYKRQTHGMCVITFFRTIDLLIGCSHPSIKKHAYLYDDDDEILAKSLEMSEWTIAETVVLCKLMRSFIFRDTDESEKVARKYLDFFEEHNRGSLQFIQIYRYFYGGLIAFDCFRRTQDQYWNEIGMRSISKFEMLVTECKWNFQNKLLLLQAEHHFSAGNTKEASCNYELAIASARDHRFIHEEALSCELAGIFYHITGKQAHSSQFLCRAVQCYTSWGADEKAHVLLSTLK